MYRCYKVVIVGFVVLNLSPYLSYLTDVNDRITVLLLAYDAPHLCKLFVQVHIVRNIRGHLSVSV